MNPFRPCWTIRLVLPLGLLLVSSRLATIARADCALSFSPAANYSTGTGPFAAASADFNADGRSDLVVTNANGSTVSVLLSNPDGTFQAAAAYTVGLVPYGIALGDFNGDGRPDLAVANGSASGVAILLASGPPNVGTFQSALNYPGGGGEPRVAVADFNGDTRIDLAVTTPSAGSGVGVLLANGPPNTGTFQTPITYPAGNSPCGVAVGDFNADGRPDVAVTNQAGNDVSIFLCNPTGTLQPAVNYPVGVSPFSIAVGDFNADGRLDLAVPNYSSANVSILLGNGNGTFQPESHYPADIGPRAVAVADFNADGRPDLAVPNTLGQNVSILLCNANGSFAAPINFSVGTGPTGIAVGDFNGDGRPDLAVPNNGGSAGNTVSVLLNSAGLPAATITHQPGPDQFILPGQTATLTVAADGHSAALTYQWRKNGVALANSGPISGATSPTLTITSATPADTGAYDAQIMTPACGGGTLVTATNTVIISVTNPCAGQQPTVTQQPASQGGANVSFTVAATSPPNGGALTYQWRKNATILTDGPTASGTIISGAATPTLSVTAANSADCGAVFDCVVTNTCGSTRSDPAGLCTTAAGCRGDFNADGRFDALDIQPIVNALLTAQTCP